MDNYELGAMLKRIRTDNKMLQTDIASIVGKSSSAISRYEKGEAEIPATVFVDLCQHFNLSMDTLMGIPNPISGIDLSIINLLKSASQLDLQKIQHFLELSSIDIPHDNTISQNTQYTKNLALSIRSIPIRGYVAAGTPIEAIENNLGNTDIPSNLDADYALIVSGNSMNPIIKDGEYVYVKYTNELNINDIGVFYYNGNVTCKKFFKNDVMVKLISINPTYEDFIFYLNDTKNETINFTIEGQVILSPNQQKRLSQYYQMAH
ncbi:MAG: XRE family transcriptional regulator [Lachnospiraceae bacterium]|nr:XRE family transcriptional regulator [Lachnospiraceae bacterium]